MKTIVEELADLRSLDAHELAAKYETLFGKPPRSRHREFLFRRCAFRVQEIRFGGLSTTAKRRLDELAAQIELPSMPAPTANRDGLAVGSVLTREWHGREIRVVVRDDGYEHEGARFRSLSALAKHITGTHWNGRAFFGVKA